VPSALRSIVGSLSVTERQSGRAHSESRWYVPAIYAWPNYVLYSLPVRETLSHGDPVRDSYRANYLRSAQTTLSE
jgi:hypothetical protein